MNDENGYDQTDDGRELIALLKKHAPPTPDGRAGAELVLARLDEPQPAGVLRHLRWFGPIVASSAAAIVIAFVLSTPPTTPGNASAETASAKDQPATESPTPVRALEDPSLPGVTAVVRDRAGDDYVIDAGLQDGLRTGDELSGPGDARVKVSAAGIFNARVRLVSGRLSRQSDLQARDETEAQKRAARFRAFGGDPGAFFQFGALFSAMPTHEARMGGISDGQAIRVDEVIRAIMKSPGAAPEVSHAARLGLQPGDVILEVNGASVRNFGSFANALGWSLDPNTLTVSVLRNGAQLNLRLQ